MSDSNQKCKKCGKIVPPVEETKTSNGVLCKECAKKRKTKTIVWIIAVVLVIAAVIICLLSKKNKVESFEGIGEVIDTVCIQTVEVKLFDIAKATAISSPTAVGDAIDDIVLFKSMVEQTKNALTSNDSIIQIPVIATLFDLDSYSLSTKATDILREFAAVYCTTNKTSEIIVEGYTCDLGSDKHNEILSQERAKLVKETLISFGVSENKIITKYYGETMYGKLGLDGKEAHRRVNISLR